MVGWKQHHEKNCDKSKIKHVSSKMLKLPESYVWIEQLEIPKEQCWKDCYVSIEHLTIPGEKSSKIEYENTIDDYISNMEEKCSEDKIEG